MYKNIGIRGHRGSGKISISCLLANTIQLLLDKREQEYEQVYPLWCDDLMKDENETANNLDCDNVYLESFGDTPKILVELLTNIPHEYIYSDWYKEHVIVDIATMEYEVLKEDPNPALYPTVEHMFELADNNSNDLFKQQMILKDFIIYYANITSKYLGKDIWVKLLKNQDNMIYRDKNLYRIFVDLKAPSEIDYVTSLGGFIINITRPNHIKHNGLDLLKNDKRWDYELKVDGDLYELKDEILKLAHIIINK